jgi:large subunit ribosomal protein L3
MRAGLLGTKIGMTRVLVEGGRAEPVTVIKAGPCPILQVKTVESDGYNALQLGFDDVKPHRSTKPMIGHAMKAGTGPKRHVRELRLTDPPAHSVGEVITVERFAGGKVTRVDVTGVTKGKGFQGVMKRHGFGGQASSHGTERKHRSAGGIGANAPRGTGRSVKKGKRMAGHMGHARATSCALDLLGVDVENDLLLVRGSVPGPNGAVLLIRASKRGG